MPTDRPEATLAPLTVTVERTAIVAQHGPVGARHGWMVLHGLDQRAAAFLAPWTRISGQKARRVLAPEGLSRHILDTKTDATGACWTTIPDRPIDMEDTYRWLDAAAERLDAEAGDGARVLLGFSQGSIMAARWVIQRDRVWDAVLIWGGAIPRGVDPHALAARSKTGRVELVVGDRDQFATPERRAQMKAALSAAGVPVNVRTFPGGHRLDDGTLEALAAELEGAAEFEGAADTIRR
ncbi:MAG: dienelactone hydrolase family protein [Myxococcales bacterium]|nr:dienelactone hydrolase family protein [Myxococcales bacterium]